MIGKLRWKFIFINMSLVATVLIIVFTVAYGINYRVQRQQSDAALRMEVARDASMPPERFSVGKPRPPESFGIANGGLLPVFSVMLSSEGEVQTINANHLEVADDVLAQAVEQVLASGKRDGELSALNLRYLREDKHEHTKIAFLDMSVEQQSMRQMVLTLALICLGALAAFFVISVFLANWALRPVERAWAQQQQFIADASHELKTPLTVILANLGIIEGHGDETVASQAKWLGNTAYETTRMRKLVDAMLFLAKSDAMEVPLEQAEFSLTDTVWRSVLSFEPVAYEQGITLDSDLAPDIEMLGDESQITQLVSILLDNACKYAGPMGSVAISLAQAQDKALLTVHNTGETIAQEDLAHIFERFYRTDKARARTEGGYGLGLAIAAQIVRRHGGKINAESGPDKGTTFCVSLPMARGRLKA